MSEVTASDYDGLIPKGSVGSDRLRGTYEVITFVHAFFEKANR